jgi:hypothetical protein
VTSGEGQNGADGGRVESMVVPSPTKNPAGFYVFRCEPIGVQCCEFLNKFAEKMENQTAFSTQNAAISS